MPTCKRPLSRTPRPAYGGLVIVTCPNCSTAYRLDVATVLRRPKLKCAKCQHRWVPAEEVDEDEAVAAVQEELRAARMPPPPPPEPEPEPEPAPEAPAEPEEPRVPVLKWLLAVALGAAFTTASVGLWIGRIDPAAIPGVADALAQVAPPPPRLDVAMQGSVNRLGGASLLEVTGVISNPGKASVVVPPLNARLMVGGERLRDWTIPPPAAMIKPGQRLAFASTITDVPAGPISVQIRFGR
ncbi:zinc-ribbon domain-containing protein [Sandarakinorhabdus cyanobacteriorum]|nr:zinc-ribbon domain-containing protein [Sandarakinorhabdus cyanobacteriorum]